MWTTGLNNYGQLGLGDMQNRKLLQHVAALDDKAITEVGGFCSGTRRPFHTSIHEIHPISTMQVTGGAHHSMALSGPTGVLYAFGRSDSSQLGIGKGDALKPGKKPWSQPPCSSGCLDRRHHKGSPTPTIPHFTRGVRVVARPRPVPHGPEHGEEALRHGHLLWGHVQPRHRRQEPGAVRGGEREAGVLSF